MNARCGHSPSDFLAVLTDEHARHDGDPNDIVRHGLNLCSGAQAAGLGAQEVSEALRNAVDWPPKEGAPMPSDAPPLPGSVLTAIKAATYNDGHFTGPDRWLGVASGSWALIDAPPSARRSLSASAYALLASATSNSDGTFTPTSGGTWALSDDGANAVPVSA